MKRKLTLNRPKFEIASGIVYLAALLAMVLTVVYAIIRNEISKADNNEMFGIILAGITITITTSVIFPKFVLKSIVVDEVRNMEEEVFLRFKEKYLPDIKSHTSLTDAHLSRMVAILMAENAEFEQQLSETKMPGTTPGYTYIRKLLWAGSWSLRSYKNYLGAENDQLTNEKTNFTNYQRLMELNRENLLQIKNKLLVLYTDTNNMDFGQQLRQLTDDDTRNDFFDLLLRTIKEAADIDYFTNHFTTEKKSRFRSDQAATTHMRLLFFEISPLIALLVFALVAHLIKHEGYVFKGNPASKPENPEDLEEDEKTIARVVYEIKSKSEYYNEEKYSISLEQGIRRILSKKTRNELSSITFILK